MPLNKIGTTKYCEKIQLALVKPFLITSSNSTNFVALYKTELFES